MFMEPEDDGSSESVSCWPWPAETPAFRLAKEYLDSGGDADPDLRRLKKIKTEVFRNFRPPRALNGPRERQRTTQDEKPVPGKGSGPPGTVD